MEQKHVNVIRTCLKTMRAFGNEKSKSDIEETLKAFDKAVKEGDVEISNPCKQCYNYNIGDGIDDIRNCEGCKYS